MKIKIVSHIPIKHKKCKHIGTCSKLDINYNKKSTDVDITYYIIYPVDQGDKY